MSQLSEVVKKLGTAIDNLSSTGGIAGLDYLGEIYGELDKIVQQAQGVPVGFVRTSMLAAAPQAEDKSISGE